MRDERNRVNDLRDDLEDKIAFMNKENNKNTGKITEMNYKLDKSKKEYDEKYKEFEERQKD